jgi:hypothetical protein
MIATRTLQPLNKARGQIAPAIVIPVRPLTLSNFLGF